MLNEVDALLALKTDGSSSIASLGVVGLDDFAKNEPKKRLTLGLKELIALAWPANPKSTAASGRTMWPADITTPS